MWLYKILMFCILTLGYTCQILFCGQEKRLTFELKKQKPKQLLIFPPNKSPIPCLKVKQFSVDDLLTVTAIWSL